MHFSMWYLYYLEYKPKDKIVDIVFNGIENENNGVKPKNNVSC